MLKTRIIPCLTIKDLRLVKSVRFSEHRNIGSYIAAVRVFNARDVDEMIVLDLDAAASGVKSQLLQDITRECFMPLTVGGGVKTLEDIRLLLRLGADKVSLNTAAAENPALIEQAAGEFGSQCIVVSIDARRTDDGHEVWVNGGTEATGLSPRAWATEAERRGAGELLLTSIDHDGCMDGYDLELVKSVSSAVSIPVIACGGAGNTKDVLSVIRDGGASAAAAASIFQYTETTPLAIKRYLAENGIDTRIVS